MTKVFLTLSAVIALVAIAVASPDLTARPLSQLLLAAGATVALTLSRTPGRR